MYEVFGGRATGKTVALLEYSAKHNVRILCTTPERKLDLIGRAKILSLSIPEPITIHEYSAHHGFVGTNKVAIDQADKVIEAIFSTVDVKAATYSYDVEIADDE